MSIKNTFASQEKKFLFLIASVAALGGFLFGYDTGIISGALIFIEKTYAVSLFMQEMIVSSVVLGALIGALMSGRLTDICGSRSILIYTAVLFIAGTLLSTFALDPTTLILGRFIIGIAIGITSYVSPLFISEMAPANKRGRLVLLNGIMITGGEAIAFMVDYLLVPTESFRCMFVTGLVPALLFFVGMLLMPASPRWMVMNGHINKAREILTKTRHTRFVESELKEIIHCKQLKKGKWSDLFSPYLLPVVVLGMILGILQQFIGINTVMYYGPTIFAATGIATHESQLLATFGIGLINMIMSIVAVLVVDRLGRRCLLLSGSLIAAISLGAIGFLFSQPACSLVTVIIFILMMIYIAGYSLSLGSLFWLVISEIYPLHLRGLAMSIASAAQWAASFMVTLTFLSILNTIGPVYTFWLYGLVCVFSFCICYCYVPETSGVTLEEIESNLKKGKRLRELGKPTRSLDISIVLAKNH